MKIAYMSNCILGRGGLPLSKTVRIAQNATIGGFFNLNCLRLLALTECSERLCRQNL